MCLIHVCTGVSLRTQELYALVFLCRYLDLFFTFISLCVPPCVCWAARRVSERQCAQL